MLNPQLYNRLVALFGRVHITNAGIPCASQTVPDWNRRARPNTSAIRGADGKNVEHYSVNCPFCGDQGGRLSIHYLYGTDQPGLKRAQTHLLKCFNEDCFGADKPNARRAREQLWSRIRGTGTSFRVEPESPGNKPAPEPRKDIRLPTNLVPIVGRTVPDHVRDYLEGRNFDPRELWDRWRVYYCNSCFESGIRDERLVIPIYGWPDANKSGHPITLVGWQARLIDDDLVSKTNPKYRSAAGFPASAAVYGLTWAAAVRGPIVICEGPTDVWRLGTNAVAVFGRKGKLGLAQEQAILAHARGRAVVFFSDANAVDETTANIQPFLRAARAKGVSIPKCVVAVTPEGRCDPGDCTREEAWETVARALGKPLTKLGVDLSVKIPPTHPKGLPR